MLAATTFVQTPVDGSHLGAITGQTYREQYLQPSIPGEVFAHPHLAQQTYVRLPTPHLPESTPASHDTSSVLLPRARWSGQTALQSFGTIAVANHFPGLTFVLFPQTNNREHQALKMRKHGRTGAVPEIHLDTPPKDFDIRVLGPLQLSVEELCAVSL